MLIQENIIIPPEVTNRVQKDAGTPVAHTSLESSQSASTRMLMHADCHRA